jgi:hypothetical protein
VHFNNRFLFLKVNSLDYLGILKGDHRIRVVVPISTSGKNYEVRLEDKLFQPGVTSPSSKVYGLVGATLEDYCVFPEMLIQGITQFLQPDRFSNPTSASIVSTQLQN